MSNIEGNFGGLSTQCKDEDEDERLTFLTTKLLHLKTKS